MENYTLKKDAVIIDEILTLFILNYFF